MIALDRLQQIIPSDIALANKALTVSLQQISKNPSIILKNVAEAASTLRTCSDLPMVNALKEPVPSIVMDEMVANLAVGSGPNGTLVISDFFGSLAGYTGSKYVGITNTLNTMDTQDLQQIYQIIDNTVHGVYGSNPVVIPEGLSGSGTYATIDQAVNALIPIAQQNINTISEEYPFQVKSMNSKWTAVNKGSISEVELQKRAGIDWCELQPENTSAMMSWIRSLPQQGLDMQPGGNHWFLQSISDMSLLAGQSIIGCLREGVNTYGMSRSGVNYSTNIPINLDSVITASSETDTSSDSVPNP